MRKLYPALVITATVIIALLALSAFSAFANQQNNDKAIATHQDDDENEGIVFRATLVGFSETPTLFSNGSGTFTARLSPDRTMLTFTLTYSGLPGAFMAHIHFGEPAIAGGIIVWLCGSMSKQNPTCPAPGGTVTGTINATDVVGLKTVTFPAGNFTALLMAMRAGATYVNVHTPLFPGGEIRGQIVTNEAEENND